MAKLDDWSRRPVEEANLFNPPFICSLICEFLKDFAKTDRTSAPLLLIVIALTTSLHRISRERLPHSTVTSLYEWLQNNEELLIGFSTRAKNITPHIKESILFGLSFEALQSCSEHSLAAGSNKVSFPKQFVTGTTPEIQDIIYRTKFMGRWLSKSGSEISIAAAWGVTP